jgi:hypothetical protein
MLRVRLFRLIGTKAPTRIKSSLQYLAYSTRYCCRETLKPFRDINGCPSLSSQRRHFLFDSEVGPTEDINYSTAAGLIDISSSGSAAPRPPPLGSQITDPHNDAVFGLLDVTDPHNDAVFGLLDASLRIYIHV